VALAVAWPTETGATNAAGTPRGLPGRVSLSVSAARGVQEDGDDLSALPAGSLTDPIG
jgi:hypothetical protein